MRGRRPCGLSRLRQTQEGVRERAQWALSQGEPSSGVPPWKCAKAHFQKGYHLSRLKPALSARRPLAEATAGFQSPTGVLPQGLREGNARITPKTQETSHFYDLCRCTNHFSELEKQSCDLYMCTNHRTRIKPGFFDDSFTFLSQVGPGSQAGQREKPPGPATDPSAGRLPAALRKPRRLKAACAN